MVNEISRDDVIQVANSLNQEVSESKIEWILEDYDTWAESDTTSNWSEIVESMIYSSKYNE